MFFTRQDRLKVVQKDQKQRRAGMLLLGWAVIILVVSSVPGNYLPKPGFFGYDKIAHALEYAVLGVLIFRYVRIRWPVRRDWWLAAVSFMGGVIFALFDELHQIPIPYRMCSAYDMVADVIGVAGGVSSYVGFAFGVKKKECMLPRKIVW